MTDDRCPSCGASRCQTTWADRHPTAAVTAALFTLTLMAMMLSEHTVAAVAVLVVLGVGAFVWLIDRERERRAATGARADRALMAAPLPSLLAPRPVPARQRSLMPLSARITEPIRTVRRADR